jgi:hypothetical protein
MRSATWLTRTMVGAVACLFVAVALVAPPVAAAPRGNSGLPDGPGNPIAALKAQLDALAARVAELEAAATPVPALMWVNHFDLLPGDSDVLTSFNAITSGVGGGLTGLVIQSTTTGENSALGGNKVVHMGVQVPPSFTITGVRVCYELSNARSFISQVRLAQVQDPPSVALVLLDDPTDLTNAGPVCVESAPTSVDPSLGSVLLSLRVNFGDTSDRIVVRGLGLHLTPTP